MYTRIRKTFLTVIFSIITVCSVPKSSWAKKESGAVVRYAIVIGANDGGKGRVPLRYAINDAVEVATILQTFGGVAHTDLFLLREPDRFAVESAFSKMRELIENTRQSGVRQEVLLYYSGHSDERGLLLGNDEFPYREFRQALATLPADVRIAILDSCSSGALARTKGGSKRAPFLVDSSVDVKGYAFMTSASADEAAQESDKIGGSFFTHFLTSGLRGAADMDSDRRVTLNEAYNYAFQETLSRTESTFAGPQHANYDFQLKGSGDLVLTDLRGTSALLEVSKTIKGRLFVRNKDGVLIAEINKVNDAPVYVGIEPGVYSVTLDTDTQLKKTTITVNRGQKSTIEMRDMVDSQRELTVTRGQLPVPAAPKPKTPPEILRSPVQFGIVPGGISIPPLHVPPGPKMNHFAVNFIGDGYYLNGLEVGSLGNIRYADVNGLQAAGLFNVNRAATQGVQAAGLFNMSGAFRGVQAAGLFNVNYGEYFQGVQTCGLFNINRGRFVGLQGTGLFNITGEGRGIRAAGLFNATTGPTQGVHAAGAFNFVNGPTRGFTASGVFNINTSSSHGFLGAGVFNFNRSASKGIMASGLANINGGAYRGLQAAGAVNIAAEDDSFGLQAAGLFNFGQQVKGMQVAGAVNIAQTGMTGLQLGVVNIGREVTGAQIGVVNIARGTLKGAQIGLINVGGGTYFAPTFWVSGSSFTNFGLKLGGRYTYAILGYGLHPERDHKRASYLYGLGGHLDFDRIWVDIDAVAHRILPEYRWSSDDLNNIYQFRPTIGYRILNQLSVYAGPTLNLLLSGDYDKVGLIPSFEKQTVYRDTTVRLSIDFVVGIQFEPKIGKLNRVPPIGGDARTPAQSTQPIQPIPPTQKPTK